MSPAAASLLLWDVWALSWLTAAVWSRRTQARPPALDQAVHLIPTIIGAGLLFFGSSERIAARYYPAADILVWRLPDWAGWVMTGLCAAGFAFAWWARLTLGDLWSGSVNRKENHSIVERGPYRLVRHPIYTGAILAAFALAIQIGMLPNLLGACLIAFGFWLKASLEERFLGAELGETAYGAYRRRTPMLVPFWPTRA